MKSGIENPSKSEVIGRCGGDEKSNDHAEPTKSRTIKKKKKAFLRHINRKHKFKCYQFWAADFLARLLCNVEFSFSDMLLYDITSH